MADEQANHGWRCPGESFEVNVDFGNQEWKYVWGAWDGSFKAGSVHGGAGYVVQGAKDCDADGNPNWQTLWKWHGRVEFGKSASWCELMACTAMIIGLHNTLWRGCGVEQLPVDTLKIALDDRWFVPRGFGKYDGQRIAARQRDFS